MAKKPPRIWLCGTARHMLCCAGRPNTCNNLSLLEAEPSEFHDSRLREATAQVNRIFAGLQADAPQGQHLALIDTSLGLLLVWAEATVTPPPDDAPYVSADSEEDAIRGTLGLDSGGAAD